MQIVGRKSAAAFLQLMACRPPRLTARVHAAFMRKTMPLFQIAAYARGHDVVPQRASAFGARDEVIERQVVRGVGLVAILATEAIAQEHVESRKSRVASRGNVVF